MLWAACFDSHDHFFLFSTVCPAHWVLKANFQEDLFQKGQYGFVITAILDFFCISCLIVSQRQTIRVGMLPMKQLSIGCFLKVFSQHDQDRFFISVISHLFYISCLIMFILWTHTQCFLPFLSLTYLFAHCLFVSIETGQSLITNLLWISSYHSLGATQCLFSFQFTDTDLLQITSSDQQLWAFMLTTFCNKSFIH